MSRQTRIDGKARNQFALWHARRARLNGDAAQELFWEQRADALSDAEIRAAQAAQEREHARQWLAAGGAAAYARECERRADEIEQVPVFPWPGGTSRKLAEKVATLLWPDCPVDAAPDTALRGILEAAMQYRPELVDQARAEILDGGFAAEYAAKTQRRAAKVAEQVDRQQRQLDEQRVDAEPADPFDPLANGVGKHASPHAASKTDGDVLAFASPAPGRRRRNRT